MSPEAQRIAIADVCRWDGDYLNDLNAMHEAEKLLSMSKADRHRFAQALWKVAVVPLPHIRTDDHLFAFCNASAAQRAEAFLKTLNLWKEDA